jgi:hypothetical protein
MARAATAPASEYGVDIAMLVGWRATATESTDKERRLAERDRDYRDGKQYTIDEVNKLTLRGQPVVQIDKIGPKAEYLLGLEQQQRTSAKAYARTPKHDDDADAWTQAIRYVCQDSNYNQVRSASFDNISVEGLGGNQVTVRQGKDRIEIEIAHTPWDRMWRDPHSAKLDFSDARYLGLDVWMDLDEAKALYGAGIERLATMGGRDNDSGNTYADKPQDQNWYDRKRRRVRISQCWYTDASGAWFFCEFTGGGILRQGPSPYVDDKGESEHPFNWMSCWVDRENRRYGEIRRMIDPQDDYNKRNSKATWLLSSNRIIADEGAVPDIDAAATMMAKPDGRIAVVPGARFDVVNNAELSTGQFALMQMRAAELETMGPNSALAGQNEGDSGIAGRQKAQGGAVGLGMLYDRLKDLDHRTYSKVRNRIRQFWDQEIWVRVTDDDRSVRYVGLNRRTTKGEQLIERAQEQGQEIPPEILAQIAADPAMQEVVIENNLQGTLVDIIIDDSPAVISDQQETFQALAEAAKGGMPISPKVLITAAPFPARIKDQMLKDLEQPPAPDPKDELEKAKVEGDLMLRKAELDLQAKKIETDQQIAMAQAQAKMQTDAAAAQTQAIVAQAKAQEAQASVEIERINAQVKMAELDLKRAELALKQEEINLQREQGVWQREHAGMDFALRERELNKPQPATVN